MRQQSDFFNPMDDLIKEAKQFTSHKTAQDWFDWTNFETMKQVVSEARYPQQEIEAISDYMMRYAERLTNDLEGYEMYELCRQVHDQSHLFQAQLVKICDYYRGFDKY